MQTAVRFRKTTHFDITGLGGPYVDGEEGEEKNIPQDHALVLYKNGVVDLLEGGLAVQDEQLEPDPALLEMPEKIADAVRKLDPEDDDHWTDAGLPAMAAIEALVGTKSIVRADVEAAAPGWDRDKALEAAVA